VNTAESQAFNLFATQSSLVLLKNKGTDGNPVLPFARGKNIAVVGPHTNATGDLVGNYIGQICKTNDFSCVVSPFVAIKNANKGGMTSSSQGCSISSNSTTGFAAAVQIASQADYVVLLIGLDGGVENEAHDRVTITLPGVQENFTQTILALKKPTVVVLINGGAIATDWLYDNGEAAILEAFYPGYHGGTALASVIFGDFNPGGKLPYTIYRSNYVNQVDFQSMDMAKAPGRTYKYFTGTPLWPFGFGLSYTTFSLTWTNSSMRIASPMVSTTVKQLKAAPVNFMVDVKNTGKVAGSEVVQAYFSPPNDPKIKKQLFGYERVFLEPGQTTTVKFVLNTTTFDVGDFHGNMATQQGIHKVHFTNGVSEKLEMSVKIYPDM